MYSLLHIPYLVLIYPSYFFMYVTFVCIDLIAFIHILLVCDFKTKHFWPYTKYNNVCLNYEQPGWPRLSNPM